MDLLLHWLDKGHLSQDDQSIHYTNYRNFHKEDDELYAIDKKVRYIVMCMYSYTQYFFQTTFIGFDGMMPIMAFKDKIVAISHNCPIIMDPDQPTTKTRAFSGYNHVSTTFSDHPRQYDGR